ncbi:putative manganese transporter [[Clostridium] scindens]|uniref:putative manganese transporter n=1 Tax=Clostridium scindens (strain JCM 10418 / VPI 12708) TaxID=29347 RepID=UPI00046FA5F8|nr:putative manganese transporter [[Clostridium] scindens]MCB6284685.1 arsenic efflux protein [[Clostridium] scindens]MCB6419366.1 arsenic efflux protein [[Clostridium] scindens]MCB7190828.1 arsenic efflux protein [[Clostridium] scindens]MCB7284431.1 arsenic efflux protein [[Clostridium] scindens]MCG4927667.1 arsenic efflux protein [[Clostridium] scindens]
MKMLVDAIVDTTFDCLKMLPFLFVAFILIEALEHYSSDFTAKALAKVGRAGPVVGAVAGCVPQCGFSVMAANLYAGGIISVGTLLSVFIATSDEAILIIMSNPERIREVGILLAAKVIIAVTAGYIIDIFFRNQLATVKESGNLCKDCGCDEEDAGIWKPAWHHTIRIFIYLFIFTGILNLCIEIFGIEQLSKFLLGNTIFQPVIAAIIGLIPNCAASVILTQLYLNGAISFASVIAGLCTGAGIGLVVLFKMNRNKRENLKIVGVLFLVAVAAGMIIAWVAGS